MPADRPGAVVVLGTSDGKVAAVAAVNEAGLAAGVSANTLVRAATGVLGGKGGGKDDVAQGGGSNPAAVGDAIAAVQRLVAEKA